ncbi:hypothetical protein DB345_04970 [Spartobacteria bacterium LR76]|nr:hypothetical protein DB345_04970 [Spartobacteria bacterium LR76]
MFQDFGINPGKFFIQMLVVIGLSILATVRVLRCRANRSIAFWIIIVWLVPVLGSIFALLLVWPKRRSETLSRGS